jgi:hypothetical protein
MSGLDPIPHLRIAQKPPSSKFGCPVCKTCFVAKDGYIFLSHRYAEPPRPVQLLHLGVDYNFGVDLALLKQVAPAATATSAAPASADVTEPGFASSPDPAFAALSPDSALQAGIEPPKSTTPLDPRPIFQQCGFMRHALATGGKDYDNPLWNLSVLCTAFMENGNVFAHEISKGHASYTPADTQALYDRKKRERVERNLGYPSCSAIEGAGCKACKTCPLRSTVKSPLNLVSDLDVPVGPNFVNPYDDFVGPRFPLEILPPTLRKLVEALSHAMGADPSAIALAGLAVLSGAMNAETSIRLADGWWEKPIIWAVLVGPPSSMKSPIIEKLTRPLRQIDNERNKHWQQKNKWLQEKESKKNVPPPPKDPRCLINDATPEKVAEILSRAPSGALMVHDELAGWMSNFERYSSGSSRAFYLTCSNGGTFTKDRVGAGKNDINAEICVDNLALSILGGVQPDRLVKLGDLTDDGLLQRFLPVLMTPAKLGDPYAPVTAAELAFERLIRSINEAPPQQFRFDEDAFEVRDNLIRYLYEIEKVDGFAAPLLGAIGKFKGYFGRLCLVLQVAQNHDPHHPCDNAEASIFGPDAATKVRVAMGLAPDNSLSAGINWSQLITRRTAEQADKLIRQFLLPHLLGFYDVVVNGGTERERVRDLADFILSSNKDRLRPSDFTAGVRSLRGQPDNRLREWVGRLCAMDWLTPEEGKPGVPIKAWHVAPGLREHFAGRCKKVQAARAEAHKILKAGGSRSRA